MEKDYILEYRKMYGCKAINDKIILKEKNEIKGMNTIGMNCEKLLIFILIMIGLE